MTDELVRMIGFSIAAVVVLLTGVMLTRSDWPFSAVLLNIHKMIALIAVVILGVLIYRTAKLVPPSASDWVIVGTAGMLCVVSFASGGAVSAIESAPRWVVWMHRIGTWFATAAVALCVVRVV